MDRLFVGVGSGFGRDRIDAAIPVVRQLAQCHGPRFLIYETLAERTLAIAQLRKAKDPDSGYAQNLKQLLAPILQSCLQNGIRIIGNFGAANPHAAAGIIKSLAQDLGVRIPKIAVVEGDDLTGLLDAAALREREMGDNLLSTEAELISANAYLGAFPIAQALDAGAEIVITGRVADPSLTVGPFIHCFGTRPDDWDSLAAATLAGHLLECGAQVSGGYFADPGKKDVPGLDRVGYPIAEISRSGDCIISKPDNTGGVINLRTVKEQLLYEIQNPAAYLTPDVVLDITQVEAQQLGENRVKISGAKGWPKPPHLKATVCVKGGYLAEGEISYAGINAASRARLAASVIRTRMEDRHGDVELRVDFIGIRSVFGSTYDRDNSAIDNHLGRDVRVRFALCSHSRDVAQCLLDEVEALYCAGPAGGAGVRTHLTERLASTSCAIERSHIRPAIAYV